MKRPLSSGLCGLAAVAAFIGAALVTVVTPVCAQTWPDRPVRIVSVSGAGSGVDDYSRQLAS
jgi:tripartite-type tricarboxylate transporter receptor subunit TctC